MRVSVLVPIFAICYYEIRTENVIGSFLKFNEISALYGVLRFPLDRTIWISIVAAAGPSIGPAQRGAVVDESRSPAVGLGSWI
jgi:hypothetical protein